MHPSATISCADHPTKMTGQETCVITCLLNQQKFTKAKDRVTSWAVQQHGWDSSPQAPRWDERKKRMRNNSTWGPPGGQGSDSPISDIHCPSAKQNLSTSKNLCKGSIAGSCPRYMLIGVYKCQMPCGLSQKGASKRPAGPQTLQWLQRSMKLGAFHKWGPIHLRGNAVWRWSLHIEYWPFIDSWKLQTWAISGEVAVKVLVASAGDTLNMFELSPWSIARLHNFGWQELVRWMSGSNHEAM